MSQPQAPAQAPAQAIQVAPLVPPGSVSYTLVKKKQTSTYTKAATADKEVRKQARYQRGFRAITGLDKGQYLACERLMSSCRGQESILLLHAVGSGKTMTSLCMAANLDPSIKTTVITIKGLETSFTIDIDDLKNKYKTYPDQRIQDIQDTIKYRSYEELFSDLFEMSIQTDKQTNPHFKEFYENRFLIFDEAHKLLRLLERDATGGVEKSMHFLLRNATRVVIMTATPLQKDWSDFGRMMKLVAYKDKNPFALMTVQTEMAYRRNFWLQQDKLKGLGTSLFGRIVENIDDINNIVYEATKIIMLNSPADAFKALMKIVLKLYRQYGVPLFGYLNNATSSPENALTAIGTGLALAAGGYYTGSYMVSFFSTAVQWLLASYTIPTQFAFDTRFGTFAGSLAGVLAWLAKGLPAVAPVLTTGVGAFGTLIASKLASPYGIATAAIVGAAGLAATGAGIPSAIALGTFGMTKIVDLLAAQNPLVLTVGGLALLKVGASVVTFVNSLQQREIYPMDIDELVKTFAPYISFNDYKAIEVAHKFVVEDLKAGKFAEQQATKEADILANETYLTQFPILHVHKTNVQYTWFQISQHYYHLCKGIVPALGELHMVGRNSLDVFLNKDRALKFEFLDTTAVSEKDTDALLASLRSIGNLSMDCWLYIPFEIKKETRIARDALFNGLYGAYRMTEEDMLQYHGIYYQQRTQNLQDAYGETKVFFERFIDAVGVPPPSNEAVFACDKFWQALEYIGYARMKYTYLPVVYSNFDDQGFKRFSAFLTSIGLPHILLKPGETLEVDIKNARKTYRRWMSTYHAFETILAEEGLKGTPLADLARATMDSQPCCVLIDPSLQEGLSLVENEVMICLEPMIGFGNQEQVYGRIVRNISKDTLKTYRETYATLERNENDAIYTLYGAHTDIYHTLSQARSTADLDKQYEMLRAAAVAQNEPLFKEIFSYTSDYTPHFAVADDPATDTYRLRIEKHVFQLVGTLDGRKARADREYAFLPTFADFDLWWKKNYGYRPPTSKAANLCRSLVQKFAPTLRTPLPWYRYDKSEQERLLVGIRDAIRETRAASAAGPDAAAATAVADTSAFVAWVTSLRDSVWKVWQFEVNRFFPYSYFYELQFSTGLKLLDRNNPEQQNLYAIKEKGYIELESNAPSIDWVFMSRIVLQEDEFNRFREKMVVNSDDDLSKLYKDGICAKGEDLYPGVNADPACEILAKDTHGLTSTCDAIGPAVIDQPAVAAAAPTLLESLFTIEEPARKAPFPQYPRLEPQAESSIMNRITSTLRRRRAPVNASQAVGTRPHQDGGRLGRKTRHRRQPRSLRAPTMGGQLQQQQQLQQEQQQQQLTLHAIQPTDAFYRQSFDECDIPFYKDLVAFLNTAVEPFSGLTFEEVAQRVEAEEPTNLTGMGENLR